MDQSSVSRMNDTVFQQKNSRYQHPLSVSMGFEILILVDSLAMSKLFACQSDMS